MPKADRPKYNYPFLTKAQIIAAQRGDDRVMLNHLAIVYSFQLVDEQSRETTVYRNRSGFMSSHAKNGTALAKKHLAGEALTDDELSLARKIAGSYGKQLAAHFREEAIRANPDLAQIAEIFSAGPRSTAA